LLIKNLKVIKKLIHIYFLNGKTRKKFAPTCNVTFQVDCRVLKKFLSSLFIKIKLRTFINKFSPHYFIKYDESQPIKE